MFDEKKAVQLMRAVGGVKVRKVIAPSYARVVGGWVETSDITHNLRLRVGAPDGVVDVRLALKAGKLTGTYTDTFPASECVPIPKSDGIEINAALFGDKAGVLSLDFAECAAKDESRGTLCGVFIGKGAICATDGHRLLTRPVTTTEGADMIITAKTIELLKKLPPVTAACYDSKNRWLTLNGNSYQLTVKTIDGVYPDFEKCIPTGQNCVAELSASEVAELRAGVETLLPFAPERSRLIKFDGDLASTASIGSEKHVGVNVPALSARVVGFDGAYMLKLLSNFPGGVNILTPVATQEQYEKDKAVYDKYLNSRERADKVCDRIRAARDKADAQSRDFELQCKDAIKDASAAGYAEGELTELIGHFNDIYRGMRARYRELDNRLYRVAKHYGERKPEPLPPDEANKVGLISAVVFKVGEVTGLLMPLRIMDEDGGAANYWKSELKMLPVTTPAPAPVVARKPEPRPAAKKPTGKISPEIEMLVAALVGVVGKEQLGRELSEMLKFARNHGAKAMYAAA